MGVLPRLLRLRAKTYRRRKHSLQIHSTPPSIPQSIIHRSPHPIQLRVTAASPGKVSFELPIEKHHTNRLNILHGGTIASMVDTSGSLVLASRGLYSTGVSTDLNVTYLNSGGKVGDTIRGEAVCDKCRSKASFLISSDIFGCLLTIRYVVGKTLAFTSVKFINEKNEIVARGSHTKFVALAHKDDKNIVDQLKPEESESKVGNVRGTA